MKQTYRKAGEDAVFEQQGGELTRHRLQAT